MGLNIQSCRSLSPFKIFGPIIQRHITKCVFPNHLEPSYGVFAQFLGRLGIPGLFCQMIQQNGQGLQWVTIFLRKETTNLVYLRVVSFLIPISPSKTISQLGVSRSHLSHQGDHSQRGVRQSMASSCRKLSATSAARASICFSARDADLAGAAEPPSRGVGPREARGHTETKTVRKSNQGAGGSKGGESLGCFLMKPGNVDTCIETKIVFTHDTAMH